MYGSLYEMLRHNGKGVHANSPENDGDMHYDLIMDENLSQDVIKTKRFVRPTPVEWTKPFRKESLHQLYRLWLGPLTLFPEE